MPRSIPLSDQGIIECRALLGLVREGSRAVFGDQPFGSRCNDLLLISAVYVGHVEGRRMTAGKLAEFAGVPRPSAIRRLAVLEREGYVERDSRGTFGLRPERYRAKEVGAAVAACRSVIQQAATALSKLDR